MTGIRNNMSLIIRLDVFVTVTIISWKSDNPASMVHKVENIEYTMVFLDFFEAAIQRWSQEKVFWKHAANLQENTHAEVCENTGVLM